MNVHSENKSETVTKFLNATLSSIKTVVPIESHINKPRVYKKKFMLNFGVLIGLLGDLKGKLILTGEPVTFSTIGQKMYGMPLEGEMINSFSGELGNMLAGNITTILSENNTDVHITTPTILKEKVDLYGYEHAIELPITLQDIGSIKTFLLID